VTITVCRPETAGLFLVRHRLAGKQVCDLAIGCASLDLALQDLVEPRHDEADLNLSQMSMMRRILGV
jgi:hypothetical protein